MRQLIRFFFRGVRAVLGPFMLLGEKLSRAQPIERSAAEQAEVDAATRRLALYQYRTCPFCIKVRRTLRALALNIELRDAQHDPGHRQALEAGGGKVQVPCLRIEEGDGSVTWLYESDAINQYLHSRFG